MQGSFSLDNLGPTTQSICECVWLRGVRVSPRGGGSSSAETTNIPPALRMLRCHTEPSTLLSVCLIWQHSLTLMYTTCLDLEQASPGDAGALLAIWQPFPKPGHTLLRHHSPHKDKLFVLFCTSLSCRHISEGGRWLCYHHVSISVSFPVRTTPPSPLIPGPHVHLHTPPLERGGVWGEQVAF